MTRTRLFDKEGRSLPGVTAVEVTCMEEVYAYLADYYTHALSKLTSAEKRKRMSALSNLKLNGGRSFMRFAPDLDPHMSFTTPIEVKNLLGARFIYSGGVCKWDGARGARQRWPTVKGVLEATIRELQNLADPNSDHTHDDVEGEEV